MLINNSDESPFNELSFFNCIISAVLSFIVISLFCFYNKIQTFMSLIICNIISISFIQSCTFILLKLKDVRYAKSLSMFCNISISLSLSFLFLLTSHYVTLSNCNKTGSFMKKMLFFILIDFIPLITSFSLCKYVFVLSEINKDNTYYLVNFCFTLLLILLNLVFCIKMFLSITKDTTVKTKKYPLRVFIFFLAHLLCNINVIISEGLVVFSEESYDTYNKVAVLLMEGQGIVYPICYLFYPPVFGIVKSFFAIKHTPKKVSTNTIHISGMGNDSKIDSLGQSLTQTIYD